MTDCTKSTRPRVTADERSQPFFDACSNRELLITRCAACSAWGAPTDARCVECGANALRWERASGRGHVHTFGVVHYAAHSGFKDEVPYNVAVVELSEGPRLNTRIVGCNNSDIQVGLPVCVTFVDAGAGILVPAFQPAVV